MLSFLSAPDFENPTDVGANNVYDVDVTASTAASGVATQSIAITVTAVNDNDPVITSAATANFAENATGTVIDVNATDADLPAQTLTFSITGGADAAKFAINASTGIVTFVASPNFEAPTDAGADNVYNLTVTASDGTRSSNQAIAITVTPVNEFSPVFTSAATANFAENAVGTVLTVVATDADQPAATLSYSISGGADAAKFAIDGATGALTFVSSPNFEAPTDVGANNVYNVQVTASDGTNSTNQALAITVTAVNDNDPVITSVATANFAENATGTVIDVNATDADLPAQTLTFSITGGADAAKFAINATTGIVTFVASPNFESPTDVGADNVYDLTVTASDGTRTVSQAIAVTVTPVNEFSPVFTSAATASFAENASGTVLTVQATDADLPAATLSYSITGGLDAAKFAINSSTGALTFVSSPNFEAPTDAGANNVYDVTVTASDGSRSSTQAIAVTVTAVNDNTPVITSLATANFAENATGTVIDVNATDADLPAQTLTFSITGGADAAKFVINATTGIVTFVTSPDFEAPTDAGANNVYDLQVTASDGALSVAQSIAVTVTAVNDNTPVITSAATANFAENATGTILTVQATDADLPAQTLTYSISGGVDAAKFAINATTGALTFVTSPNFEAPTDVGANNVYNVQVTASDGANSTNQALAITVTAVNDNLPVITSSATTSFGENGTGTVIDVNATDADLPGDTLTFSISGGADAAKFAINSATGVLTFVTAPDFEAPTDVGGDNIYNVQVTASDGTNNTSQNLVVTVTDVGPTVITSAATANFAENGSGTALDVDATSEGTVTYSISGGVDAAKFAIDAVTGVLTFVSAPDFESPNDAGADNIYNLQVTASTVASGIATQNLVITVTAVNDNDPVFTSAATANFAENATGTVVDVNATDADLPAQTLTFSITGGADAAKFAINASTGIVTFISSPNFEAPTDAGADNVYNLTVTASDGTRSSNQAIAITVTPVNEFSPVFTSAATANFAENAVGTVLTVVATDADQPAATLTYSISGGADAAKFAIDGATGALTFVSSPNFEAPTDVGANNVYNVQVTASDGTNSTNQALAITVTAVNDNDPVITTAATANFAENATGTVIDVNATDADLPAQTLTFSITGGADAAKFAINATTGIVTFVASPNFEAPTDAGANNVYDLTVTASDGARTTSQNIAVTVTPVNEFSPVFTSSATANVAENASGTVLTVQANDADLPGVSLVYGIAVGGDGAKFAINSSTGALSFILSPNFEAPADAGANNVYDLTVTASDGTNTTSQVVSITITPVNEFSPVFTSLSSVSFAENGTGTVIDVNATDADLPAQTLTFSITGGADAAKFAINASTGIVTFVSAPDFENPTDVGGDNIYNLQVTASDGSLSSSQSIAVTVTAVNEFAPVFTSAVTANFAENGSGTVLTVQATDADLPAATLSYSITGGVDAAKFAVNASTGALTFVSSPNFEAPTDSGANNVYNVQVTASDGTNSTNQALAITVTAVNDNAPVITSSATVSFVENGIGAVLDVNATDADLPAQTLTYSISGGADQASFTIDSATGVLSFVAPPDFEAPTDSDANNIYLVDVAVSDGSTLVSQSVTVTVTDVSGTTITSGATASFAENGTGTAIDVDASSESAISYSISGGADAGRFSIDAATGVVTFVAAPNFEAPVDADGNNIYVLDVTADGGVSGSQVQTLTVTVTAVNDNAPVITSSSTVSFVENGVGPVVDVNATDADLPAQTLTYSITGGADAAKFAINASTGVVTFVSAPNFEAPTDVGADNVYVVQVTASDGALTSAQTINVTVSNTDDAPVLDASKSPALVDVSANAAAPVGTVGTLVSALVANGSGIANVSDEDGPGVGLALTSVDVSKGTWWFSTNNGTTWSTVGTVSSASALLLTGANRLYLQPAAGFSGAVATALTFQAWDTSSGTAGAKVSTAGSSAFSVASDTASISVVGAVTPVSSFTLDTILVTSGNGFRLSGGTAGDGAGGAIAGVGDINGDGIGDLLVGAPSAVNGAFAQAGLLYGVLGQANRNADVELAALNGTNGGFVLTGQGNSTTLGASVAGRGDFNGDGLSDFVFGAPGKTLGQGEAYEMFGTSGALTTLNGFSPVNLNPTSASFPTNDGVKMVAPATFGLRTGEAVATGGDFNGDGFADSVVGMPLVDTNGASAGDSQGQVFIAFGGPSSLTNLSLTSAGMTGTGGINLDGTVDFGQVGRSVAMGDFDGDHLADVVISALGINTVYVVSGNTVNTARDNLNLANLNGANGGVKLVGPAGIDFGKQVVNVGDVNADGRDDFLVLAPKAFPVAGGSFGGAAYVVFGTNNTTLQTVNVATLNGSNGFLVHGAIFRPAFGTYGGLVNAAAAGDVNGDGIADIVLTQTLVPQGFDQLGETFVIYGKAGSFADVNNLDLHTGLNGSNGFRIVGAGDDARVSVVAGGGDLNNDGFDEMLLSMPNGGPVNGGQVIVVNGGDFRADASSAGVTTTGTVSRNADTVTGTAGADQIDGGAGNDVLSGADGNDIVVGGVGNDTLSGGNGVDSLVGGQGDDVLDGGAGADTLYAGPGNDTLVYDAADVRIDGGYGTDTLQLAGAGVSLNLDNVSGTQLRGLEAVDLTGSGANSLRLNVQDLLNLSDTSNTLTVLGDGNDSVVATGGWGSGVNLGTVTQFTHGHAILLIDNDVLANAATSII